MKPKEIVRLREAAKDMTHDALVTTICTLVDDYKRQSEEIERLEGHNLRNFNLAQDNIKEVNRLNDFIVKMTKEVEETIARVRSTEPVAWSLIFNEKIGVNPETTFKTEAKAEDYAKKCGAPKPRVVPLYGKPAKPAGLLDGPLAKRDMEITRQSALLEEARKLADMAIDCVTIDVTMQGPRVTGVNGSAALRASEMARSFLSNLEAQQP